MTLELFSLCFSCFALGFNLAILMEVFMKRRKMSHRGSKKLFAATASKTHRRNVQATPMRGGGRL